ncbi:MAG: radical SAM family heme chaperone HemW [Rhodothermia bacterium]|nr:radical SAM family heme chaperone HemW [Rhodothermia bacterium]
MAGIYIHVPFCSQRCSYCDFYFVTTAKSYAPYMRALQQEIAFLGHTYGSREKIDTIYIGGGTPSLLHGDDVTLILASLAEHFDTSEVTEITFELNPEDYSDEYLRYLKHAGVTRLSIGVQSFFDSDLQFMNRSHRSQESEAVIIAARQCGFDNFSVDLIFGLPDQPTEYWAANLEKAVELGVPHLSTYGLTIEEKTPLHKQIQLGKVVPVRDDEAAELYRFTMTYLQNAGYDHYETSSFSLPSYRSRHNQGYWHHRNYLGFGPSSHSFWWAGLPARRWANVRNLKRWQALLEGRHSPVELREKLDLETLGNEYIMLRIRTSEGLDLAELEHTYGLSLYDERIVELAWLESEGLIRPIRNDLVQLTDDGKLLTDMVTSKLVTG